MNNEQRVIDKYALPKGEIIIVVEREGVWETRVVWYSGSDGRGCKLYTNWEHPELFPNDAIPKGVTREQLKSNYIATRIMGARSSEHEVTCVVDDGSMHLNFFRIKLSDLEQKPEHARVPKGVLSGDTAPRILTPFTDPVSIKVIDDGNIEIGDAMGLKKMIKWTKEGDVYMEGDLVATSDGALRNSDKTDMDARRVTPSNSGRREPMVPDSPSSVSSRKADGGTSMDSGAMWFGVVAIVLVLVAVWLVARLKAGTRTR